MIFSVSDPSEYGRNFPIQFNGVPFGFFFTLNISWKFVAGNFLMYRRNLFICLPLNVARRYLWNTFLLDYCNFDFVCDKNFRFRCQRRQLTAAGTVIDTGSSMIENGKE